MTSRIFLRFVAIVFGVAFFANIGNAQISRSVGLLKGEVTLSDGTAVANIPVVVYRETERVTSTKSTPDGKVTAILQPNATYRIAVNTSGYMYQEDTITVPVLKAYQEFPLHIVLTPLRDQEIFDFPVPIFEPRSHDISSAAYSELDRIAGELRHNPKLSVSVVVYPDAPVKTKKDAAQKSLAAEREAAMRSYFLGKNVPSDRFTVETVTTMVPEGKFPMPANLEERAKPAKGRKKKAVEAPEPTMFPQYVEIMAHIAS